LAAFSSYMYVTCTWKKLPKQRSYEKRARIKLMKLSPDLLRFALLIARFSQLEVYSTAHSKDIHFYSTFSVAFT